MSRSSTDGGTEQNLERPTSNIKRQTQFALSLIAMVMALPAAALAQMAVEGQVTNSAGAPVQAASVSITELGINTRTNAAGRYNFLIRAAQIRGQTVSIVARHGRLGTHTVQIQIAGGTLVQNFVLGAPAVIDRPRPPTPDTGRARARPRDTTPRVPDTLRAAGLRQRGESVDFATAGPVDLVSALAGRHAALHVTSAATPGASSRLVYRGARSFAANVQPLVVVDGVPVDNTGFASMTQRFGLGGFDYGNPLQDVAIDDIDNVYLLDPVTAASRYGSRAANGVLVVSTKTGRAITGLSVSATARITGASAYRLPDYQNSYGQGLGGQFEFFDGQGGGINDAIAESWGPKLDASAIAQHSVTEPRRPDVRHFLPQPEDIDNYFEIGRMLDATLALQGSRDATSMRAAFNARSINGLTPGATAKRLGITLGGAAQPMAKLGASANFQLINATADQRPGTGFDEINPVSGFVRMGRQVDLDGLRENVTDANGDQINWIYANRNNPFFATSKNANDDERTHLIGRVALSYALPAGMTAQLSAATDDVSETRHVSVAKGWLGGFPTTLGRGDFSGGGTDNQSVSTTERLINLALQTGTTTAFGLALSGSAGAELRSNEFKTTSVVSDQPATGPSAVANLETTGSNDVTAFHLGAKASGANGFFVNGGVRLEQLSAFDKSFSTVYPSVSAGYDLAQAIPSLQRISLGEAQLFVSWWRAGNEVTSRTLSGMYFGGGVPIAPAVDVTGPELTMGMELGASVATPGRRGMVDLRFYRERSKELLVAAAVGDGSALLSQSGEIFNSGFEAKARAAVVQGEGITWDLAGSLARNTSTVDALLPGTFRAALSPTLFNASLAAEIGSAAGVIVGSRYLRSATTGQLLLQNGLPIADAGNPFSVLGSVHPDWTATIESRVRFLGAELLLLVDSRRGGRIFSATNLWGSYAGTLSSTLIGDRDRGGDQRILNDSLTVAGLDSVTGAANTVKVSAEQYFHALGAITEPWVYDASFTKLREARLSYEMPTQFVPGFREHRLRLSLIGRNLATWAKAPNIDPETTLGVGIFQGFEMGQLPGARSLGLQITIAP